MPPMAAAVGSPEDVKNVANYVLSLSGSPHNNVAAELGKPKFAVCAACHGPEGKGDGAKAPFLSPRPGNLVSAATSAKSDKELLKIIANGKPHTAMPSWDGTLSAEDQEAVLRYIRSLVRFSRPQTPSPPTP